MSELPRRLAYENLLVETSGPVAVLTINRPDKRNALNQATREDMLRALDELQHAECRVLVVTGAGEKAFVAGADINEFAGRTVWTQRAVMKQRRLFDVLEEFPKPVIAMINGYCLGGGLELAMACDIRVAADSATLGQPEINLGLIPGAGGTQRLTRLVGEGHAMELILSGDPIDAAKAKAIGLVNDVVPASELRTRVMTLASRIGERSPVALRVAKEAVKTVAQANLRAGLNRETDLFCLAFGSADRVEGVTAFLEKRKPRFTGE